MMTWVSIKENLIVVGIFTGILFPLRLVFYHYLSSYWLGSFGIVTAITLTILYLSNKGKLGSIGGMIIRRFYKRARGKSGIGAIIFSIFFIYFCSLIIAGCTYADQQATKELINLLSKKSIHDIPTLMQERQTYSIESVIVGLIVMLTPNQLSFVGIKTINELSNGWMLSFFTVDLAEAIEVLGLMFYLRYSGVLKIAR